MKLYATITNERATGNKEKIKKEGLGSNEHLEIELTYGNSLLGRVIMRIEEVNNKFDIYFYPVQSQTVKKGRVLLHEQAKKQNGECTKCKNIHAEKCVHGILWHDLCEKCIPF